jgi:hypothetical protein
MVKIGKDFLEKVCSMAEKYLSVIDFSHTLFYFQDGKLKVRTGVFYFEHPLGDFDLEFIVNGSDFTKAVKVFPGDIISLDIEESQSLIMFNDSTRITFKVPAVSKKISFPVPDQWSPVSNEFLKSLKQASRYIKADTKLITNNDKVLSCIYLQGTRAYATDTISGAYVDLNYNITDAEGITTEYPFDFVRTLLPYKIVSNIKTKDYKDLVGIHVTDSAISFKFSSGCIAVSSLATGNLDFLVSHTPSDFAGTEHMFFNEGVVLPLLRTCRESQYAVTESDKVVSISCNGTSCHVSSDGAWKVDRDLELKSPVNKEFSFKISLDRLIKFMEEDEIHYDEEKGFVCFPIKGGVGFIMTRR